MHILILANNNQKEWAVRLACLRHAASVHPGPGSNPQKCIRQAQHFRTECNRSAKKFDEVIDLSN